MQHIIVGRYAEDYKKIGEKGVGYIGRHYVGSKSEAHLANPVYIDFIRPHLIGIFGKRGTGKSYTLGVMVEEMMELEEEVRRNIGVVLFDAMGIYWSMKHPNDKDKDILKMWQLEEKGYDIRVYIPYGLEKKYLEEETDYDDTFSFSTADIDAGEWGHVFNIDMDSDMGILLDKVIKRLKDEKERYSLEDIINNISLEEGGNEKEALINRFEIAKSWGIFSLTGKSVYDLVVPGSVSIIDLSQLPMERGWDVRSLIVGILSKKILNERIRSRRIEEEEEMEGEKKIRRLPITWIYIDEAHQFLPEEGETAATLPLLQIIKIGREPGVSLVLATQMPYKLHHEAISQCDLVISHRLTSKKDIVALSEIMQTYERYSLVDYFDAMPREKGSALIMDDNSERIYEVRIRPRRSWHAGGSAIALK